MENEDLQEFLKKKGYTKCKLKLLKTNHFQIKATINGKTGVFILDTGASSSLIGTHKTSEFNLLPEDSEIKATGAGASNMSTQISTVDTFKIGRWKKQQMPIILFNLTHVNEGLISQDTKPVDGIIGADILKKGKAIIDYQKKYLYLKLNS
jgi:predicted aspartyl protease